MEGRKLNLNAPFLSVRRIAKTPVSADGEKEKIIQRTNGRHSLPPSKSDYCLEQVTEPVAVPFNWEQIPGKSKEDKEPASQHEEETSVTPRLPPGKVVDHAMKQSLERDDADHQSGVGLSPQFRTNSLEQNVKELKSSKENDKDDDDDDDFSDALDTISPTESFSMNCSANGLSQCESANVKPSSITPFSIDSQTRDFMMNRFLPAAKAMAFETPQYAAKKQYAAPPEPPRQVTRVIHEDTRRLPKEQGGSHMELQYGEYKEEEESEGEDDEYDPSGSISAKGCGLFPRLCLLSPIPGMKARARALMPSSSGVVRPDKSTYSRSHCQSLNKHSLDAAYKRKPNSGAKSGELQKFENKKAGGSNRFAYSGELKKGMSSPFGHSRSACISPYRSEVPRGSAKSAELHKFDYNKQVGESSRFLHSGDLKKGTLSPYRNGAKSGEMQKFGYKQASESIHFIHSGDLRKAGRSSPLMHSRSAACISPYRNEAAFGAKSAEFQKFEYKQAPQSISFARSGDLADGKSPPLHSRSACISPYRNAVACGAKSGELQKFEYKQAPESIPLTNSGDLANGKSPPLMHLRSACISPYRNQTSCRAKSGELHKFEYKQTGESRPLAHSGDLMKGRSSSPLRHSRSACISPYRNEAPKSPFPAVGLLGIPREESAKANNKFNKHDKNGHSFQKVLSHQRSIQGPPRAESSIVEKTLYVDTVNTTQLRCSNSSSFDTKEQAASTAEYSFQDIKCLTYTEGGDMLEPEVIEPVDDNLSSLSGRSNLKGQVFAMKDSQLGIGQEIVVSPLPPPLPKSPTESWLWSALSSISSRNPISRSKRLDSKTSSMSTKWETIVKTSHLRHDHVRYSEELVSHISKQSKS